MYFCHFGCPVQAIDEQVDVHPLGALRAECAEGGQFEIAHVTKTCEELSSVLAIAKEYEAAGSVMIFSLIGFTVLWLIMSDLSVKTRWVVNHLLYS